MLRYVGVLWDRHRDDSCAKAAILRGRLNGGSENWDEVLHHPGLSLFVIAGPFACYAAHPVGDGGGSVLGVLFDRREPGRSSTRPVRFFGIDETDEIVASDGRYLVERYWGRYVAFLCDPSSAAVRVLRDPIGDIPCYHAQAPGIHIYFSALPDLLQLQAMRLTLNWEHIGLRVITGNAWAEESALNEIECVHPGECFEHQGDRISRQYYWHPFVAARRPPIEQLETAASELRSTTAACLNAWASLYPRAIHVLSGGLDSSIVLKCLAQAPAKRQLTCLNFRTRDPDSDERRYARLVTASVGCELVEVEREAAVTLERIFECYPTVGPLSVVMRGLEVQPLIADLAQQRGAQVVFSGDGGDVVFFRGWPQLAVMDCAHSRRPRSQLIKLALDASEPAQLSVWQLLYDAVKHGIFRRKWDIRPLMFEHYRLITDEVMASARTKLDFLNPWNLPADDLPPGKLLHAFSVSRPSLFRNPLPGPVDLDFINPLLSQPLVELCLRIPTYVHAANGADRAVARAAFAAELPCEIVTRTWKGAANRRLQDLLIHNLALVREILLDGRLVKAGILDGQKLAQALSVTPVRSVSHATEVFSYFCTEVWLRRWSNASP